MAGGHHLVLAGFMGTGKSTIGAALARRLGRQFVDLDQLIEEREGLSVEAIFAQGGEDAFRAAEGRALEAALSLQEPVVLALGGGTLHEPASRARLVAAGVRPWVLHLDEGARRERRAILEIDGGRPLLHRYEELYRARATGYSRWGEEVDVSGLSAEEAVSVLLARLGGAP